MSHATEQPAIRQWFESVEAELQGGRVPRAEATQRAARKHPQLREQFVTAYNSLEPAERQEVNRRYR